LQYVPLLSCTLLIFVPPLSKQAQSNFASQSSVLLFPLQSHQPEVPWQLGIAELQSSSSRHGSRGPFHEQLPVALQAHGGSVVV
jgi:hypothetical protein